MLRRTLSVLIFFGLVIAYYLFNVLSFVDQINWSAIQRVTSNAHLSRTTEPLFNFGMVAGEALLIAIITRVMIWRIRGPYVAPARDPNVRFHIPFMHWPRVRSFNERFWPLAGIVSPFVLAAHHAATFWGSMVIGVGMGQDWNSSGRWTFRIFAVYVIVQAIAAIMRPTRQAANMIRDILVSTVPLFVDAIVLYAYFHDGIRLSDYQWAWLEGDLWYVAFVDLVIFSVFMAEIDFYQAPIYRTEAHAPPPS